MLTRRWLTGVLIKAVVSFDGTMCRQGVKTLATATSTVHVHVPFIFLLQ